MIRPPRRFGQGMALLLAGLSACAAAELPDKPILKPYDLAQRDFQLKSGLRVLVQEDHSSPLVVVVSSYRVGGTSDPKGMEGLAHMVEHLAFRTRPGGGAQLWDHLQRLGASFNASTGSDLTTYYSVARKEQLNDLMQLEAWRLVKTIDGVTPEVFDTEREVVRNELRQRQETSLGNRLFDLVLQSLFPAGHPLSRSVAGTHESLSSATLVGAQSFVKQHYRPENCSIVIAGDVNPDEVKKYLGMWPAEALFGPGGPDGPTVPTTPHLGDRPSVPVPDPGSVAIKRYLAPVAGPRLVLAWALPGSYRGNESLLNFVASRLSVAVGSGLERKEGDDIDGVGVGVIPMADASTILVQAQLRRGADPEKARSRILDTVMNSWASEENKLTTEESRWFTATNELAQTADLTSMAEALAEHVNATGHTAYFKDTLEELAQVQSEAVTDLASKWLKRQRAIAVFFEPESEEMNRGKGGGGVGERSVHTIGGDTLMSMEGMSAQELLKVVGDPGLARVPRFKLANGLEVITLHHGSSPVAQIQMWFRGGDYNTTPQGLASLSDSFARSRCRIHGDLEPVGGRMGMSTTGVGSLVDVQVLSGNLANGVAVLADAVSCQEADEEAFMMAHDVYFEMRTHSYKEREKLPAVVANRKFWGALYPGHPRGNPDPDPALLKGLPFETTAAFVRSHFRPERAMAIIVGDVEPAQTHALAEKYLSSWAPGGSDAGFSVPVATQGPTGRQISLINRAEATQATVQIGCRLPTETAEAVPAYDLLEALVTEKAWAVREQWGATYGIAASVGTTVGGGAHLLLSGAVENRQGGVSVARLLGIIDDLAHKSIDNQLFQTKRWDVARKFAVRFATGDNRAEAILEAANEQWPADVWDKYGARLVAVTPADIQHLLAECAGKEVVTVVGNVPELRTQLKAVALTATDP